jgi:hypothetical protein
MRAILLLVLYVQAIYICLSAPITGMSRAAFKSPIPELQGVSLQRAIDGKTVIADKLIQDKSNKLLLVFLTHLGDLGSWELAQRIKFYLPQLQANKVNLLAIAPGSLDNAKVFCQNNPFPIENLYMDREALCYKNLDFSRGAFPDIKVSPYLKLLPMLAGIESKGTIPEVLRGYFGDRNASPEWIKGSLTLVDQSKFDIEGKDYQV